MKRLHLLQLNFTLLSVVQRYKCSEIAQALKESHICLLVSFVISGSSYINSLFQSVRRLIGLEEKSANVCAIDVDSKDNTAQIMTSPSRPGKDHRSCKGPKTRY